jgi:hypothetical protein
MHYLGILPLQQSSDRSTISHRRKLYFEEGRGRTMARGIEGAGRRHTRRVAACAAAVGIGAGIITGTGVASAQPDTDPTGPPANEQNALGPTVNAVTDTVNGVVNGLPVGPSLKRTLTQTTNTVGRIATNHSLVTAR